jgi:L,D-peptidoglycan transpeptidase YkuD (ErfK/YbiS/YcfS/YnhG family)
MKKYLLLLFLLFVIANNARAMDAELNGYYLLKLERSVSTGQVITVENTGKGDFRALVNCYEKRGNGWKKIYTFDAVTGRAGIMAAEKKREGDKATPAGVYTLGLVFGYDKKTDTKMGYRELTDDDIWIDDPEHPMYNRLFTGKTDAKSFEKMRRNDDLYRFGIVINYNTEPVVRYKGSAIFLHIWRDRDTPTSGCVAVPEEDIKAVISWLDPEKDPLIMIGKEE